MKECPLIAILRGITPEETEQVCDVLYKNGIRLLEIPLNSPNALKSIEIAVKHTEGRMLVGAGTVLTPEASGAFMPRAAGSSSPRTRTPL